MWTWCCGAATTCWHWSARKSGPATVPSRCQEASSSVWPSTELCTRPALILADEPTGKLDSATGQQILELMRRVVDHEGTTVLMSTHDLTVDLLPDLVVHLEDGRVVNGGF
jgi:ABC-type cobalamin/Fe3+-siderophores transport system ATPase subunit